MKEQRCKSKKTGTLDISKHKRRKRRDVVEEATGDDGVLDAAKLMNIISPKKGSLSKTEKAARAKAAKDLMKAVRKGAIGSSIHALRKELTKDDDGGDITL